MTGVAIVCFLPLHALRIVTLLPELLRLAFSEGNHNDYNTNELNFSYILKRRVAKLEKALLLEYHAAWHPEFRRILP